MKVKKYSISFLVIILISLAVSPAFALGEGNRNLLLIVIMGFSPLIILWHHRFDYKDLYLFLFMGTIILFPLLFHPETMRWSTVLYSCMFCLTFLAYNKMLERNLFTIDSYLRLLKLLIYAYFIVLLIQQFCVLTNLPIFNLSNYNPKEPWKLNSLAAEPSHSARIVALLMYCFIAAKEIILGRVYNLLSDLKTDKWVWIAFIWTMVTMGSGTAFLFIGILLFKFIRLRNLVPLIIIVGVTIYLANIIGITAFERTYKTIIATITLDENKIIQADHSASVRIVPMVITAKMITLNSFEGWFGHGIDYVSSFMYQMLPGVMKGISGGGLFQLWLEYGFISFVLFVSFSLNNSYSKGDYLSLVFWFILVFLYGVNSQIVWLAITLLFTNQFYSKNTNLTKTKNLGNT